MAGWKKAERIGRHVAKLGAVWMLGLIPGTLYIVFNPDHIAHVDRFSYGPWLQALKYTPLPHLASFIFGVLLAGLDEVMPRPGFFRLFLGLFGFVALFAVLSSGVAPYPLLHDGMLMPLFGCMILGLAGENPLAYAIGCKPLVFVGEASYCLYLLHFNMWNLIHDTHVLDRVGSEPVSDLVDQPCNVNFALILMSAVLRLYFH